MEFVSDDGKYFYISTAALDSMIGNDQWNNEQVFRIQQSGSRTWTGSVMLWRRGNEWDEFYSHGRRNPYDTMTSGQWAKDDTVVVLRKLVWL